MAAYLVTGNPGSGKSALAHELARRGLSTADADYDAELSYWEDEAGTRMALVDGPPDPDLRWLQSHRWVWSRARLDQFLAEKNGPLFVCGIALNLNQLLDLFDRVFLLQIDEATQEARLVAHDLQHPPGRTEPGREQIRNGRALFQTEMVRRGAVALDGTAATAVIADKLLALVPGI